MFTTMLLPNFLIVGERRAGTSGLAAMLERHPQVFVHPKRDRGYFLNDEARRGRDYVRTYVGGKSWEETHSLKEYSEFFEAVGPIAQAAVGEKSADYFFSRGAPVRITRFLSEVKFIVTLREPVARAWSHYWKEVAKGRERLSFDSALKAEADGRRKDPFARNHLSYLARGFYDESLKNWYQWIEPERILVTTLERRIADNDVEMRRILMFLGVNPMSIEDSPKNRNTGRALTPRTWIPDGGFRSAVNSYGALVDRIAGRAFVKRQSLRRTVAQIAKAPLFEPANRRFMSARTRRYLEQIYAPHISALESLLGRELTEWKGGVGTPDASS
jgi:hypothetical protein